MYLKGSVQRERGRYGRDLQNTLNVIYLSCSVDVSEMHGCEHNDVLYWKKEKFA